MIKKLMILSIFQFALLIPSSAQERLYTTTEKQYHELFVKFKHHLISSMETDVDVLDTVNLKFVLANFVLPDSQLDSTNKQYFKLNEVSKEHMNEFVIQFRRWYNFFTDKRKSDLLQHLNVIPIRLSVDKCIYNKLTHFQRKNTFVYFDDRKPKTQLGYILFLPKLGESNPSPKILSWTLEFQLGHWSFRSLMGEVGIEHFISEGVKGPEHPIGN